MKNNLNKKRGFTLIELLVVISIISLLSTVVLGALGESRAKAEYKRFAADLDSFQKAMQLYYQDNNTYPNFSEDKKISEVTQVLVDNDYLAGGLSYVNNTDENNNTYYIQNINFAFTCGSDNKLSSANNDYTIFIYDSNVYYTEKISSRFEKAYVGTNEQSNFYCIHY